MQRRVRMMLATSAALAMAGCSRAPEDVASGPVLGNGATADLAFTYDYGLALPSGAIDGLQEVHAAACEALGVGRCRITGLDYTVDRSGAVSASLAISLAAPLARRFGRDAIAAAARAGATVTGVRIGGGDAQQQQGADATVTGEQATADLSRIDRELARRDLPPAERAELRAQRAARLADARTAAGADATARTAIAMTPMRFGYATGRGAGLVNQLADARDLALASITTTLTIVLRALALLAPPALMLLVLFLLWRRFGAPWWRRLAATVPAPRHDA